MQFQIKKFKNKYQLNDMHYLLKNKKSKKTRFPTIQKRIKNSKKIDKMSKESY